MIHRFTAELLAQFGEVSAERVAEIRSGTGHLDTAGDLIALSRLFEDNWQRLQGKSPVTRQQVVRAGIVGTDLIELLGTRRFVPAPIAADDPIRVRARAFTLLVRKYDECRRTTVALRWHEDDADAFMPTLYAKRRRRADEPIEDETTETELPPAIEPVVVAPVTPGVPTPIAADVPVTA